jgi:hypothetical protein
MLRLFSSFQIIHTFLYTLNNHQFTLILKTLNPFHSNFSANRILPSSYLFWAERGWWITCNYPTVLKEKNTETQSKTCAVCWLKSVLHEEKRRTGSDSGRTNATKPCRTSSDIGAEQGNHTVGRGST